MTGLTEELVSAVRATTTQHRLRPFVEFLPEPPDIPAGGALENMIRVHIVEQDDATIREERPIELEVSLYPFVSMITVDEDQVELVAIGSDFFLHLRGLRIPLKEAPIVAEHEMVNSRPQIRNVYRDLLPGRESRKEKERAARCPNLHHIVGGKPSNPVGEIQKLFVDLHDLTTLGQKLLTAIVCQALGVGWIGWVYQSESSLWFIKQLSSFCHIVSCSFR